MATTEVSELVVPYVTSGEIYAVSIVLPLLGIVFVLLRFYARVLLKTPIGNDDWLLLPALVCIPYSRVSDAISDSWLRYDLGFGHRHGDNPHDRLVASTASETILLKHWNRCSWQGDCISRALWWRFDSGRKNDICRSNNWTFRKGMLTHRTT